MCRLRQVRLPWCWNLTHQLGLWMRVPSGLTLTGRNRSNPRFLDFGLPEFMPLGAAIWCKDMQSYAKPCKVREKQTRCLSIYMGQMPRLGSTIKRGWSISEVLFKHSGLSQGSLSKSCSTSRETQINTAFQPTSHRAPMRHSGGSMGVLHNRHQQDRGPNVRAVLRAKAIVTGILSCPVQRGATQRYSCNQRNG